jgi:hypothetical protein
MTTNGIGVMLLYESFCLTRHNIQKCLAGVSRQACGISQVVGCEDDESTRIEIDP